LTPILPAVQHFASDVLLHRKRRITPYWLTILGPSGIGKTLILSQLYRLLANNVERWPIQTDSDGSDRFAECAHVVPGRDLDTFTAAKEYGDFDLIYLEDFGATSGKGSGAVTLDRSIELMLYRPKRWTLLDANMSFAEIGELAPRLASRLLRDGSKPIELPQDIPDFNLR
jgi:hypothetical protein